jgi:hypothetical protein
MNLSEHTEPIVVKVAQAATYSGGGLAAWFAYNAQIIAAVGGLVIGLVGLAITWYYKHQHYLLAKAKANEWSPLGDGE